MELSSLSGQQVSLNRRTITLATLLGAGAFGSVYSFSEAGEQLAIKLHAPPQTQEMSDIQINELMLSLTLSHPNIVPVQEAGIAECRGQRIFAQVMELASSTLKEVLEAGCMAENEGARACIAIVAATEYLHGARRLIHRDVKPANVLRCGGEWKLADFGCARPVRIDGSEYTRLVAGTGRYAPPELMAGRVSTAFDVWSLGVVIHEVLTRKNPVLIAADGGLQVTLDPELNSELKAIITSCLKNDPRERISASELLSRLRRLWPSLDSRPVQSSSTSAIPSKTEADEIKRAVAELGVSIAEVRRALANVEHRQARQAAFQHWSALGIAGLLSVVAVASWMELRTHSATVTKLETKIGESASFVASRIESVEKAIPRTPVQAPEVEKKPDTPAVRESPKVKIPKVAEQTITVGTDRATVLRILGNADDVSASHLTWGNCWVWFDSGGVSSWDAGCSRRFPGVFIAK